MHPKDHHSLDHNSLDHNSLDHHSLDHRPQEQRLIGPRRAALLLKVSEAELLVMVNSGQIAAYEIGDQIRFRYRDVGSLASRRAIAA